MNNNLHELIFVLDQSTEIKDQYSDAEKGFTSFIEAQKKAKTDTAVTVNIFGSEYVTLCDNTPIEKFKHQKEIFPISGSCPLIDSAEKAVFDVGERLNRTYEGCRPGKVIVIITAFGRDNASKKHTYAELAEIIRHQTEVYKWSFFLLTDFSINMEKMNIPEENTVIVKKTEPNAFEKAYAELNEKVTALRDSLVPDSSLQ